MIFADDLVEYIWHDTKKRFHFSVRIILRLRAIGIQSEMKIVYLTYTNESKLKNFNADIKFRNKYDCGREAKEGLSRNLYTS